MMTERVTSVQNPKIKELLALQEKSRLRRGKNLFVVEGRRELGLCLQAGFKARTLFVCPEIIGEDEIKELAVKAEGASIVEVSPSIYEKIAYRGGTEGVLAEVHATAPVLEGLVLPDKPLIIVLEAVEKPGNLGAVLRSADAAGADAVIICDPLTDIYNPNLIRASVGAVFTVPTVAASTEDTISWLKRNNIQILTAQLQDSLPYYDTPMSGSVAIVMGTEATGLSKAWREAADAHIMIPMLGKLDSLNVSVSAAILLFEAVRQRSGDSSLRSE